MAVAVTALDAATTVVTVADAAASAIGIPSYDYYDDEVLADTPALFWPSLTITQALDVSGNGRNGTVVGAPVSTTAVPTQEPPGSTDTGLVTDGIDDSVNTGAYQPFVNGTARTFEGWAYLTAAAGNPTLLSAGGTGGCPRLWLYGAAPDWSVRFDQGLGTTADWLNVWPGLNQWVHWALVFNEAGDTIELFINGVSKGSLTFAEAYGAGATFAAFGLLQGTNNWEGRIAKPAIYEAGLSAARILAHYQRASTPDPNYAETGYPLVVTASDALA